jgi:hypothetical protein
MIGSGSASGFFRGQIRIRIKMIFYPQHCIALNQKKNECQNVNFSSFKKIYGLLYR